MESVLCDKRDLNLINLAHERELSDLRDRIARNKAAIRLDMGQCSGPQQEKLWTDRKISATKDLMKCRAQLFNLLVRMDDGYRVIGKDVGAAEQGSLGGAV